MSVDNSYIKYVWCLLRSHHEQDRLSGWRRVSTLYASLEGREGRGIEITLVDLHAVKLCSGREVTTVLECLSQCDWRHLYLKRPQVLPCLKL